MNQKILIGTMKRENPRNKNTFRSAAQKKSTSWEPVDKWYHKIVGEEGHYYHKQIILPALARLMQKPESVLDLACGNGILARQLESNVPYLGVDISPSLIKSASQLDKNTKHQYQVADITHALKLAKTDFSHATIILAIQNVEHPQKAFENVFRHLRVGGQLIIVMNHPCFRIPRQSSWGVDQAKKIQYRRLDRYATPLTIPIQAHPGKGEKSEETVSFHHPISHYVQWLKAAGFVVENMEEWCSDKVSEGGAAKMENRSREEFPLFLCIVAKKI